MKLLLLSGAHLLPSWRHWEDEMATWCRQRDYAVRTLHPPSLIQDAAYRASQDEEIEEQVAAIGNWQRKQTLGADAVLVAADPTPEPGLAMLAGWAAANGKPVVLYHSDPRTTGEWGQPLDVLLSSLARASGGGVATGLEELHNMLARCAALAGESRILTRPPLQSGPTRTGPKPVITFEEPAEE